MNALRTEFKDWLETRHAEYLEEDFQPSDDWWGSDPD